MAACNDYIRLGPNRSLAILARQYNEVQQNAITKSISTLGRWSTRFDWQERAEEYDARLEDEKNQRIREIMSTGLALTYERIDTLKGLAQLLLDELHEKSEDGVLHNLWLPDVKQIGGGEYAERVDIERYNSPLISDIRGVLDDLAKETGGRIQKQEHSGAIETIQLTKAEWQKMQQENREKATQTVDDFEGADG